MSAKDELIAKLRIVLEDWEAHLARLSEEEAVRPLRPGKWSTSDVIGHLRAWQQLSIARLEAARLGSDPCLPEWLGGADPSEAEDNVDVFNARIHESQRDRPWPSRYEEWREGFHHFLALAESIPEAAMFDERRFAWLHGDTIAAVLEGSCEHHQEHLDGVLTHTESSPPRS